MSVYIDQKIEDPLSAALKTLITWHKRLPLLAVASFSEEKGGIVSIYQHDNSVLVSDISPHRGVQVTSLEWHPVKKILFIGWESGDISVWNSEGKETFNFKSKHDSVICIIRCNDSGSLVVTGDLSGICIGWGIDQQGMLSTVLVQDVKDSITDMAYRNKTTFLDDEDDDNIAQLAHAAISGDEKALNLFSEWKPFSKSKEFIDLSKSKKYGHKFYIGCLSGIVFYLDDSGNMEDVLQMETSIRYIFYYQCRDVLIIITESLIFAQYRINKDGMLTEFSKIKLSGRKIDLNVIWSGDGILAACTGERIVHMWDVNTSCNDTLSLDDLLASDASDVITCISFQPRKSILSAGTAHGHILSWKRYPQFNEGENEKMWQVEQSLKLLSAIVALEWCKFVEVIGVMTASDVFLVTEQDMCFAFKDQMAAVQLTAREVVLESEQPDVSVHLLTDMHIKAVSASGNFVGICTGKKLVFYEINFFEKKAKHVGSFFCESQIFALYEQSVYIINASNIEIKTFQGTLKQTLSLVETEGVPVAIDVFKDYLVVATTRCNVMIWDISRREAKLHFGPRTIDGIYKEEEINSIRCNSKGNKVSIIMQKKTRVDYVPDSILYILDIDSDIVYHFDFAKGKTTNKLSALPSPVHQNIADASRLIAGRYPVQHFWVKEDERLIVCEAAPLPLPVKKEILPDPELSSAVKKFSIFPHSEHKHKTVILSLYITPEQGILIQDQFFLEQKQMHLLGISVPYYYILKKIKLADDSTLHSVSNAVDKQQQVLYDKYETPIDRRVMREFDGMERCDKVTKEALMSFSYFLTIGNLDEAFKAIKVIKTQSVWSNMARMCIKTKRLDVAKVCLGKMENIKGAVALEEMENELNSDVKIAILAIHLGMLNEAENLLVNCKRYDILNLMYEDCGKWDKALEVAEKHDRIHLRNTYYNYAQHLEFKGDIAGAIQMYEKAEVHVSEVSRMLHENHGAMEAYVAKTKDPEVHRWWAQYLESIDEMESALQFYESAKDYFSLVRLYCYCNNLEKAAEIANETGDRAACFHVGRQFENQENIKEAVHFFTRARAYTNAIRVCKENGLDDQLMSLALMSGPEEKIDVAKYYERKESQQDKAILLYHKAGLVTKAVELAFKNHEFNVLQTIVNDLSYNTCPQLLNRCAEMFVEHEKYEMAVDLLARAGRFVDALDLCINHNIMISEQLAEKLTLPKDHPDANLRSAVLEKIGECCVLQKNYYLAAKKFTQAGNKLKAMKALLKSGDTEKIIFFATVSRQKEIYIMAANYLQAVKWKSNPATVDHIATFYTKVKHFGALCSFYGDCIQYEIEDCKNYEKALQIYENAYKCLSKNDIADLTPEQIEEKRQQVRFKMELVRKFVEAHKIFLSQADEAVKQCRELLAVQNIEVAIRKADIYGFIVEILFSSGNYYETAEVIKEMRAELPDVDLKNHVQMFNVQDIYCAVDIPSPSESFVEPAEEEVEDEDDENSVVAEDFSSFRK